MTVYLYDAWGTVTGHVFRPTAHDGAVLRCRRQQRRRPARARLHRRARHVPRRLHSDRPVFIETFEAATARVGSATGRVDFAHQTVPIDVVENAVGLVKGVLLAERIADAAEGMGSLAEPGAAVGPRAADAAGPPRASTVRSRFPGASQGLLSLQARREGVDGSATAQTTPHARRPGRRRAARRDDCQAAHRQRDRPVYNADGTPGANALVEVCGPPSAAAAHVTAGADGTFGVDNLPLGRFVVRARSQVTHGHRHDDRRDPLRRRHGRRHRRAEGAVGRSPARCSTATDRSPRARSSS